MRRGWMCPERAVACQDLYERRKSLTYLMKIKRERMRRALYLKRVFMAEIERLIMLLEKEFDFKRIYLFGSIATARGCSIHSDIDLAIEGLKGDIFLKVLSLLLKESRFDIDLKPFEELKDGLKKKIEREGIIIYEKR